MILLDQADTMLPAISREFPGRMINAHALLRIRVDVSDDDFDAEAALM